jgi:alkylmercury lyase
MYSMNDARLRTMVQKMAEDLLDYGPGHSHLLLRVMRRLAQGNPVTAAQVDEIVADLGLAQEDAQPFLRKLTERNPDGQIIGIMGLSLNDYPHRLLVNGVTLSAWCAVDTLFLPAMLQQTVTVESSSPLSKEKIRLTVSPKRVEAVSPASAVVSIVVVDPTEESMASVEAIWMTFCNHILYFASREEAERWAAGRSNLAVLTVDEGFDLGRQLWSRVLPYVEASGQTAWH